MATFGAEEFYLFDTVPGPVNPHMSKPVNGFDSTHSNNVSTPTYVPGTKIMSYNEVSTTTKGARSANIGGYTCVYAQYVCATTAIDVTAGDQLTNACGTATCGLFGPMAFCGDTTAGNGKPLHPNLVVACADMTPNSYGWFWCEGVCPQEDVTALDASAWATTDGSISQGDIIVVSNAVSSPITMSKDVTDTGLTHLIVGWAYAADT